MDSKTHDRSERRTATHSAVAVNTEYAAYAGPSGILVQCLLHPEQTPVGLPTSRKRARFIPVLAISAARPNLLALADGARIQIWNIASKTLEHVLKGNGRQVTSIAFAVHDGGDLAVGTINGAIGVWDLDASPPRPRFQISAHVSACERLALHPRRREVIAAVHGQHLTIWSLQLGQCIFRAERHNSPTAYLGWESVDVDQLLIISQAGLGLKLDLRELLSLPLQLAKSVKNEASYYTVLRGEEDTTACQVPAQVFDLKVQPCFVQPVGSRGWLVLQEFPDIALLLSTGRDQTLTEEWRVTLHESADCAMISNTHANVVELLTCFDGEIGMHNVPTQVLENIGWQVVDQDSLLVAHHQATSQERPTSTNNARNSEHYHRRPHNHEESSNNLRGLMPQSRLQHVDERALRSRSSRFRDLDTPPTQSMTSSLELPGHNRDESDSPMPFLSPAIPARRGASNEMLSLDDSLHLPTVARASFDSVLSTAPHDSDSDDEAFPESVPGNRNFFLGRANIPLPRTCGAVFGPTGNLVIFRPFRSKPAPAQEVETIEAKDPDYRASDLTRLFPTFGNIKMMIPGQGESNEGPGGQDGYSILAANFTAQLSSFESQLSWNAKSFQVKPRSRVAEVNTKTEVDILGVESLSECRRTLATQYQVHCHDSENLSDLCRINAGHAASAGLHDAAEIWTTLGFMLPSLCPPLPSRTRSMSIDNNAHDLSVVSQHDVDDALTGARQILIDSSWSNHPFGKNWAMRRVLEWAEKRTDIQLLASISALIKSPAGFVMDKGRLNCTPTNVSLASSFSGLAIDLHSPLHYATSTDLGFSAYHSRSVVHGETRNSPTKPAHSRASSRYPSLPTTPYLDSGPDAPPLSFAAISRQGSRLSASGSASPEHSRASFGAAARSYAQSITDRFASYGSSPPFKKYGTSPNNDLSSSLPSGSWSKSVSFASTTEIAKASLRASSSTQDEEDYDSDRTIDDTSVQATPKSLGADVPVVWKNENSFFAEDSPILHETLLDSEMSATSDIWCRSYAEMLRSWDLLVEAAEMEKLSSQGRSDAFETSHDIQFVVPRAGPGVSYPTCSICFAVIFAAENICPDCFHTAHTTCSEALMAAESHSQLLCPTGCGCDCVALPG